jgi:hypothetical protein
MDQRKGLATDEDWHKLRTEEPDGKAIPFGARGVKEHLRQLIPSPCSDQCLRIEDHWLEVDEC